MKSLFAIFLLSISITSIFACTCVNSAVPFKQHNIYLKGVKAIFDGEVISVGDERKINITSGYAKGNERIVRSVKFKVFRIWKGFDQAEITVDADADSSCNIKPEVGNRVTVYASDAIETGKPFSINYCSVGHFDDKKMMVEYGEGMAIEHPEPVEIDTIPEGFFTSIWSKIVSFFS